MAPKKKLEVGEIIDLQAEVVGMEIQQDARSKKGTRKRKVTLRFTNGPLKGETLFVRQELEQPKSGGGGRKQATTRKQTAQPTQPAPEPETEDELDEIELEDDEE